MAAPHDTLGRRGLDARVEARVGGRPEPSRPRMVAPARRQAAGVGAMMGVVSTRTLIVLAAACAVAILAASAIQILLAR